MEGSLPSSFQSDKKHQTNRIPVQTTPQKIANKQLLIQNQRQRKLLLLQNAERRNYTPFLELRTCNSSLEKIEEMLKRHNIVSEYFNINITTALGLKQN